MWAAPKTDRIKDFKDALFNKDVQIIWCFSGGYGASELLDELIQIKPEEITKPKVLVGYSDITVLHVLFNEYYKLPTIHALMLEPISKRPEPTLSEIVSVLKGKDVIFPLEPLNNKARNAEKISAPITGGNTLMLGTLLKPPVEFNAQDKICFVEQHCYVTCRSIHRELFQLKSVLQNTKAIIFGDFTPTQGLVLGDGQPPRDEDVNEINATIAAFITEYLNEKPCFRTSHIGGVQEIVHPCVLGYKAEISPNQGDYKLTVHSPFELVDNDNNQNVLGGEPTSEQHIEALEGILK